MSRSSISSGEGRAASNGCLSRVAGVSTEGSMAFVPAPWPVLLACASPSVGVGPEENSMSEEGERHARARHT